MSLLIENFYWSPILLAVYSLPLITTDSLTFLIIVSLYLKCKLQEERVLSVMFIILFPYALVNCLAYKY
jgi:hypothetical protein